MYTIKLICSIIFLVLGFLYLYRSDFIMKINSFARRFIFNDAYILLYRKKIGVIFVILSIIALYMAGIQLLIK
ncbi:MAG: hypothetical protein BWY26_00961 [Elusimicrobia bacterium ADurb.Bin231]|nr:MAG: hypothetical protein BWY26_00961 [Elusimicrobia bacterium ADurb.Bin231]